jgi:hypothetical protein
MNEHMRFWYQENAKHTFGFVWEERIFVMKKKIFVLLAAAAAGVLLLTACTSSEQGSTQTASGTQTGSTTQNVAGTQTVSGSTTDTSDGQSTGTSDAQPSQADAVEEVDLAQISGQESAEEPDGDVISDEDAASATNPDPDTDTSSSEQTLLEDGWTGTYTGETQNVVIDLLDAETIAFSFSESGISGTAAVDGTQAVYKGDDHYVVVFNLGQERVDVSVSNEEDYDASDSPLIGQYVK